MIGLVWKITETKKLLFHTTVQNVSNEHSYKAWSSSAVVKFDKSFFKPSVFYILEPCQPGIFDVEDTPQIIGDLGEKL